MHTTSLLTETLISLAAVMSPGPDFAVVSYNSFRYGRRIGFATALGIAAGSLVWVTAALGGVCALIAGTPMAFGIFKMIGAGYLVYLGFKTAFAKKGGEKATRDIGEVTCRHGFMNGLKTNVLGNPKAMLFFMSFFSVFIEPSTPLAWKCVYGYEVPLIACAWFSLVATALSAQAVKRVFERFWSPIERVTGAILILLGLKLVLCRGK